MPRLGCGVDDLINGKPFSVLKSGANAPAANSGQHSRQYQLFLAFDFAAKNRRLANVL